MGGLNKHSPARVTDLTGQVDVGNGTHGVLLFASASGTKVGGTASTDGNIVSGNGSTAVFMNSGADGTDVESFEAAVVVHRDQ